MENEIKNCHYCKKDIVGENKNFTQTLYGITKTNIIPASGYSYDKKEIIVPRCKKCFTAHQNIFNFTYIPIFAISFLSISLYLDSLMGYNFGFFLLSVFLALVVTTPTYNLLISFLTEKYFKTKCIDEFETYPEIIKLTALGWTLEKPEAINVSRRDVIKDDINK